MTENIQALPLDELRTLHREIGALIGERRHQALQQLQEQIAVLGFTPDEIVGRKKRGRRSRNPDYPPE